MAAHSSNRTAPRIEAVFFADPNSARRDKEYRRLAAVLDASARSHCPGWRIGIRKIGKHGYRSALIPRTREKTNYADNAYKSVEWGRVVEESADGDRLVLLDVDTFIRRPLDSVWDMEFDIARTVRSFRWPYNSGVMFVRVNERSKRFFRLVTEKTLDFLKDRDAHAEFEAKYGGIHQAAIGAVIESGRVSGTRLLDLPCAEWNNEHSNRHLVDQARIVHFLPSGRRLLFGSRGRTSSLANVIKEWHVTEQARAGRWNEMLGRLAAGSMVAEVGVWRGDASEKLLASKKLARLYLIDPWKAGQPGTDWWRSGSKMPKWPQRKYDEAYQNVRSIAGRYGQVPFVMRKTSREAAAQIKDRSLDMVFIDANHSEAGVRDDILTWEPKVKIGGWIGGHDLDEPRFPGVRRAVEVFYGHNFEVGNDYVWFKRLERPVASTV